MTPPESRSATDGARPRSPTGFPASLPIRAGVAVTLVLAVASCGETGGGGWAGSVDTLSSGTVRVRNPASGLWTDETRPRPELTTTIGRATGEEPFLFGDVRDIEVDGMGRVWVLDNQNREVRVFGPDGRHVRTVGGAGEGPGEFRNPNGIARDPGTGRIWVVDPATGRYTVFDTAGSLVETRPRDATGWGYRWPGRFDRDRRLFDFMLAGGVDDRFRGIVIRSGAGDALDTLRIPTSAGQRSFFRIERENGMTMRPVPYVAYGDWEVAPVGTVWATRADAYRLQEVTAAGDTARIVTREHEPVSVTEAERDSIRRDFVDDFGEGAKQVDFSRIPGEKAAIRALFVGRTGRVWVLPYGRRGETGRLADVFGSEGRYLGRLELPVRLRWSVHPIVTEDALYGVRDDPATGVNQVVRVAIER